MPAYSIVECNEKHNSRSENWTGEGSSASVVLEVAYDKRYELVIDLLNQTPGRGYPFNGQTPVNLYVQSVSVNNLQEEGFTQDGQAINYNTLAEVTVNYSVGGASGSAGSSRVTEPTLNEEVLVEETLEPQTELHTMDAKNFSFNSDPDDPKPLKEGEEPVVQEKGWILARTIKGMSRIHSSITDLLNSCNSETYVSEHLGLTFQPEELIFMEPDIRRTFSRVTINQNGNTLPLGERRTYDITLRFGYKKGGWNKYPSFRAEFLESELEEDVLGFVATSIIELKRSLYTLRVLDPATGKPHNPQPRFVSFVPRDFSDWLW